MDKYLFFIMLCLSIPTGVVSNDPYSWETKDYVNHVIVLIDRSGSMVKVGPPHNRKLSKDKVYHVKRIVTSYLKDACFGMNKVIPNRTLLEEGDYLSILTFGINKGVKNFDDFIHIADDERGIPSYGEVYSNEFTNNRFHTLWNAMDKDLEKFFRKNTSAISFANHMAIDYLKQPSFDHKIHRTFLIFITDDQYNADQLDPNAERNNLTKGGFNFNTKSKHTLDAYSNLDENFIKIPYPREKNYTKKSGEVSLRIFEYVPRTGNFDIQLAADLPEAYEFKRSKKGFKLTFEITPKEKSIYVPDSISINLIDSRTQEKLPVYFRNGKYEVEVADSYSRHPESLSLSMRFWVRFKDKAYGVHELHPAGSDKQGRNALNQEREVSFETKPGLLKWGAFGDMLYYYAPGFLGEAQSPINTFWSGLFTLIGLLMILIYIRAKIVITKLPLSTEI